MGVGRDEPAGQPLSLGEHTLDIRARLLRDREGNVVELRPQAWGVLEVLAGRLDAVVTKDELLDAVWPGVVVTDASLAHAVSDLRNALGDAEGRIVKTVPRRGYMLVSARPTSQEIGVADAPLKQAIAVLAFRSAGGSDEDDSLAQAIAFQLCHELARNSDLRVMSHHSSFAFSRSANPLPEICRRLGCRYLVDGVVTRSGEQATLEVDLIDGVAGHIVWTHRQELGRADLRALGEQILRRLAAGLSTSAFYAEFGRIKTAAPRHLDVYALTMRSLRFHDTFDLDAVAPARALLEQALALDSDYAPAWAWLALLEANAISLKVADERPPEILEPAISHAMRALALDGGNVVAWRALGVAHWLAGRFETALASTARGVELAPSNPDCLQAHSTLQLRCGQIGPALASIEACCEMHPLRPPHVSYSLANALWASGQPDKALDVISVAAAPPGIASARLLICCLIECERKQDAEEEGALFLQRVPGLRIAHILSFWAEQAGELRRRIRAAFLAAGIPD